MESRKTKQKSIIINNIINNKNHPTIKQLYLSIKEQYPSIGQATIYRTINNLYGNNQIKKIIDNDGIVHYDGDNSKHYHLKCRKCKKIVDIFDNIDDSFLKNIEENNSIKVENYNIIFEGLCKECCKK